MTEVVLTISPRSLSPKFARSPITGSPVWETQSRRPPRGRGRDLQRQWWTPPWRRRYRMSGPNAASFKQKSFRWDLSSPQEEPLSPRESSTKKDLRRRVSTRKNPLQKGHQLRRLIYPKCLQRNMVHLKLQLPVKMASLSKATPSKSL